MIYPTCLEDEVYKNNMCKGCYESLMVDENLDELIEGIKKN